MMLNSHRLIGMLAGFGLLFGAGGAIVLCAAEASIAALENKMKMPHRSTATPEFQKIEQALEVKLGVSAAGVGLIGLELWWFLGCKPKSKKARHTKTSPIRINAVRVKREN